MAPVIVTCAGCGASIESRSRNPRKWCSQTCRAREWERRTGKIVYVPHCRVSFDICARCGQLFQNRRGGRPRRLCSVECDRALAREAERSRVATLPPAKRAERLVQRRRHAAVRRARKRARPAERFDPREVYERDGYICGICHDPVDPRAVDPDPRRASLDHIVPIARGGAHTRENTQCSHLECNVRRGARELAVV